MTDLEGGMVGDDMSEPEGYDKYVAGRLDAFVIHQAVEMLVLPTHFYEWGRQQYFAEAQKRGLWEQVLAKAAVMKLGID